MDLAAAAGARATRMSLLWAGEAAGGRGQEQHSATGSTTTRPLGADRHVSPEHGTRKVPQASRRGVRRVFIILTSRFFLFGLVQSSRLGDERDSNELGYAF